MVDAFRVESLPESEQAAGMASYVRGLSHRHAGLDRGRAVHRHRLRGHWHSAQPSAWMWGYVVMAAMVLIGTITALARHRARAIRAGRSGDANRDGDRSA